MGNTVEARATSRLLLQLPLLLAVMAALIGQHGAHGRALQGAAGGGASAPLPVAVAQAATATNKTLAGVLQQVATPDGALIITTFKLPDDEEGASAGISMLRNFCHHLQRQGLLQHTLLLTRDEQSWQAARAAQVPATLDKAYAWDPAATGLPTSHYTHDYWAQKYWWCLRALELGYHVLFMDSDIVVLGDVLAAGFQGDWELQGLSDWMNATELPATGDAGLRPQPLYIWVKDASNPRGAELRSKGVAKYDGTLAAGLPALVPFQSTGIIYLRPTPLVLRFLRAFTHRIQWEAPWQWDQAAWCELLVSYLWGMGDDGQLRYRLLPVDRWANIGVYKLRKEQGLHRRTLALHAGGIRSEDKIPEFQALHLWQPDKYELQPSGSAATLDVPQRGAASWVVQLVAAQLLVGGALAATRLLRNK